MQLTTHSPQWPFQFGSRPTIGLRSCPQNSFRPIEGPSTWIPPSTLSVHFSDLENFCHNWSKFIDSLSALSENVNQVIFRQNGQFCSYLEILICLSRKPRDKSKVFNLIHLFINYQFIIWSKIFENFENPFVQINIHRAQLIVQHIV